MRSLRRMARHLVDAGWPASHVRPIGFRDRFGSNIEHADEIAEAVRNLDAISEDGRVDVVAHSMGGLAVRWWMARNGGHERVRRAVFLATPHRGTLAAWVAWGGGAPEMRPGSRFLQELEDCWRRLSGLDVVTVSTPFDLRIFPGTSARLEQARHYDTHCLTHHRLLTDRRVLSLVCALLDGSNESPGTAVGVQRSAGRLYRSGKIE